MNNDRVEVNELILEIADYTNDYADMAAERLLRKCSTFLFFGFKDVQGSFSDLTQNLNGSYGT
jgi:hypothetical protein